MRCQILQVEWNFAKFPKKILARGENELGPPLWFFEPERGNPLRFFAAAEVPFLATYIAKMSVFLQAKTARRVSAASRQFRLGETLWFRFVGEWLAFHNRKRGKIF